MIASFSNQYSKRSDDELLLLASDRATLKPEASSALDAELRRRSLTKSDEAKYRHFIKRHEQREAKIRSRKIYGDRGDRISWVELLAALIAMALISSGYAALPSRYKMSPDWESAALIVMFSSVFIATLFSSLWWRRVSFWFALIISSALQLLVVHAWIHRVGKMGRDGNELAFFLGPILFFVIYGSFWVAWRTLNRENGARQ